MKQTGLILACWLGAVVLATAGGREMDITTLNGTVYSHVTSARVESDAIVFMYNGATVKIPITNLTAETRAAYGYNAPKAQKDEQPAKGSWVVAATNNPMFEKGACYIHGKVTQVMTDGILVSGNVKRAADDDRPENLGSTYFVTGMTTGVVVDQEYRHWVYDAGSYQYVDASGNSKTVIRLATSKIFANKLLRGAETKQK
jgi:hypothetical protein